MKFFAWFNQHNNHDSKKKRNIDNTNVHDTKDHVHDDRNSRKKRSNAPITKDNQQTGNTRDTRYIPDSVRQEVFERDGRRCANCGSTFYLEFDHIISLAKGGATSVKTSKCSADSAIGRKDFHDEISNNTRCSPAH